MEEDRTVETYLRQHPEALGLIDWDLSPWVISEVYFFYINVWNCRATLSLAHRQAGGGSIETVAEMEPPEDLLEVAVEEAGGWLNRSGWYPLNPELTEWVKKALGLR